MSRQADIERLARFMGWEFYVDSQLGVVYGVRGSARQFDPFTSLDDAMKVAEKIGDLVLTHSKAAGYWYVHFNRADWEKYEGLTRNGRVPAEAIALAALAYLDAVGFK